MNKKPETMLHPFTNVPCEVIHLQAGEPVIAGDVYRSVTLSIDGTAMGPDTGGIGRWFFAPDSAVGSIIHPECNVHFIRLLPIAAPKVESGLQQKDD